MRKDKTLNEKTNKIKAFKRFLIDCFIYRIANEKIYEEISEILCITPKRARQLEAKAIETLEKKWCERIKELEIEYK